MPSTENKVYDKKIAVNVNLSVVGFLRKKESSEWTSIWIGPILVGR